MILMQAVRSEITIAPESILPQFLSLIGLAHTLSKENDYVGERYSNEK
jgi:hypothetical protein